MQTSKNSILHQLRIAFSEMCQYSSKSSLECFPIILVLYLSGCTPYPSKVSLTKIAEIIDRKIFLSHSTFFQIFISYLSSSLSK